MKSLRKVTVSGDHIGPIAPRPAWTILWDTKVRPYRRWNKAGALTRDDALNQAMHFLRLGFIVHAITDPTGAVVIGADAIAQLVQEAETAPSGEAPGHAA